MGKMQYQFYTADVFSDRLFGGNQLAVFPDAVGLTAEVMQKIAAEFNFSETVFVLPPTNPNCDRKVRIFTPSQELPFAGHPTLGTAHILAAIGAIPLQGETTKIFLEEGVGPVPVKVYAVDGKPVYTELTAAQAPVFGPESPPLPGLAKMLSLESSDLLDGEYSPEAVSCGLPYLFIPLRNRQALARAKLNKSIWQELLASYWAPQVYLFCHEPELEGSDLRARMFAPALGVEEDPATGSAATALGGYLGVRHPLVSGKLKWVVEQGFEMGRPSLLQVEADKENGKIKEIRVGGASVMVSEGWMTIIDK
jgi:trans-2,3-dihydro-3-hydroxyanthranilate isomerase